MPYKAKVKDKRAYGQKLIKLIQEHKSILIISVDNVGSSQIQQVRQELRKDATILMGKNVSGLAAGLRAAPFTAHGLVWPISARRRPFPM